MDKKISDELTDLLKNNIVMDDPQNPAIAILQAKLEKFIDDNFDKK